MRDAGEQGRNVLSLQTQQLPAVALPLQANRRLNNSCSNIQRSGRRQRPRRVCLSDEQHHQHQLDNRRRRRQSGQEPPCENRRSSNGQGKRQLENEASGSHISVRYS